MSEFRKFNRLQIPAEMRPYVPGEKLDPKVSISDADLKKGSPKLGDMISRNPVDHNDMWLVGEDYFQTKFDTNSIGE